MNNYLPKKIKTNFFSKLINKVRKFFFKTKKENIIINNEIFKGEKEDKNDFAHNIQVDFTDINIKYEQKTFMNKLTKQPQLLENFSNDRLEKILQYYLEENEKKRVLLGETHGT